MARPVNMPKQGQSVESCIITRWFKKTGENVKKGDLLFSYETDKAAFEEEAQEDGVILAIYYQEGDEVPVHARVAWIGAPGEVIKEVKEDHTDSMPESPVQTVRSFSSDFPATERIRVSPRARKMAEVLGIDLKSIKGSGPGGRIIEKDIRQVSDLEKSGKPAVDQVSNTKENGILYHFQIRGEFKKISNIRRIIATSMKSSLQNSAQLTHHMGADARKILALREKSKALAEKGQAVSITLNDMVCYAVIRALKKMPAANAHFLEDRILTYDDVHLGIAVDTDRGLMVPVLRQADQYNLPALAVQLKELAALSKKGTVAPELLAGTSGSFTVSNLGSYGVELFTPVLNLPQVGILGVNTIQYRPADIGNNIIGFVPYIGLSLTYDHRALDGAPASAFLREIKIQIENFDFPIE